MTGGTPPICIKYGYGGGHLGRFRSTAAIVETFFLLSHFFFYCTALPLQQVNQKKKDHTNAEEFTLYIRYMRT